MIKKIVKTVAGYPPGYLSVPLLIVLASLHFFYGFIPAWNNLNSDFPNYYTSSRMLLEEKDLSNIYNDDSFRDQMRDYGINEEGKFSPFPPATAFTALPVAIFDPLPAKRIFLLFNVAFLLLTAYLFKLTTQFNFIVCLNFILLSGAALINNFLFGQFYLLLLMLVILDYYFLMNNVKGVSGAFWGIGASIKYIPLIFVPALIAGKKFNVLKTFILSVIAINLAALFFFGFNNYAEFFNTVFVQHLNGKLSGQSEYAIQFQSWNSFLRNLFVYDPELNSSPFIDSAVLFQISRVVIYLVFISGAVFSFIKIKNDKYFIPKALSLSSLLVFVLAPASASYHLLLLIFPVVLLTDICIKEKKYFFAAAFVLLFVMTGFSQFIIQKINAGLILSFYRLWFVTGIFAAAAVYFIKNNSKAGYYII